MTSDPRLTAEQRAFLDRNRTVSDMLDDAIREGNSVTHAWRAFEIAHRLATLDAVPLDVERLAEAALEASGVADPDMADIEWAKRVAAEYARLASPEPREDVHDHIAWAQHVRSEHEATHGEAEQCGAACIVLGLAEFDE